MSQIKKSAGPISILLTGSEPQSAESIEVVSIELISERSAAAAVLTVSSKVRVPTLLLKGTALRNSSSRPPPELGGELERLALERVRRELERLDLNVDASAAGGAFFGKKISGAAEAQIEARLRLDASGLLDTLPSGVDHRLLDVELRASAQVQIGGQSCVFACRLQVRITVSGEVELLCGFDLPAIRFETPGLPWNFALDGFELDGFERLLRLDLPLPQQALPVRIQWAQSPRLRLSLDAQGAFGVSTETSGQGALEVLVGEQWSPVVHLDGIGLPISRGAPALWPRLESAERRRRRKARSLQWALRPGGKRDHRHAQAKAKQPNPVASRPEAANEAQT